MSLVTVLREGGCRGGAIRSLAFALSLIAVMTPGAGAQRPDGGVCWRGRPRPACTAFPLVEIQGMLPLMKAEVSNPPSGSVDVFGRRAEVNFGLMVNVGPRWAMGGTVFGGGSDQGGSQRGLRARVRRWLGPTFSGELIVGSLRENVRRANGLTAEVRLTGGDLGALFVRWNGLDLPPTADPLGAAAHGGGFEQTVDVGGAVGSTAAVIAGAVAFVAGLLALANSPCCS